MEKMVLFRDRQEVSSGDLNNVQLFARAAIDRVVREGMTNEKKFTGFLVTKSGATTVNITTGAFWMEGKVYIKETNNEIDFLSALPLTTKKIIAIVVSASDIETDTQPRDFLIDVDTGATEPSSVAMEALRYAQFNTVQGTENSSPQKPTTSTDDLVIAWVTLDTSGVASIERATANELMSTKQLDHRTTNLEAWRTSAGERLETLGSDISALAARQAGMANTDALTQIFVDLAQIKEQLEFDSGATSYGAFRYIDDRDSDTGDVNYNAKALEGVRFDDENANVSQVTLFNPNEPKVKVDTSGLVLPDYEEVRRIAIEGFTEQMSLNQYTYQLVEFKLNAVSSTRLRTGPAFTYCANTTWYNPNSNAKQANLTYDWRTGVFTDTVTGRNYQALGTNFDARTATVDGRTLMNGGKEKFIRLQEFWYDEEVEFYQERVVTDVSVNGALSAQTFLNTQNGWLTSLDLAFTQVAGSGNVTVLITRTRDGKPDLNRVISQTTIDVADMVQGETFNSDEEWTNVPLTPTALSQGEYYGVALITGGDHYVGLAQGSSYASGTLFNSTDGAFLEGNLNRDMMIRFNFAEFKYPRIEVELGALNLTGGMDNIDLLAEIARFDGTSLTFEVRPDGTGEWYPLTDLSTRPFVGLPALAQFRAVFLGTKDVQPGINLNKSRVTVARPRTTFLEISTPVDLALATQDVTVQVIVDWFNPTNHTFDLTLDDLTNGSNDIVPASVTQDVLDNYDGTYQRTKFTFTFTSSELPTATSQVRFKLEGTATSAQEVFHVESLVWLGF